MDGEDVGNTRKRGHPIASCHASVEGVPKRRKLSEANVVPVWTHGVPLGGPQEGECDRLDEEGLEVLKGGLAAQLASLAKEVHALIIDDADSKLSPNRLETLTRQATEPSCTLLLHLATLKRHSAHTNIDKDLKETCLVYHALLRLLAMLKR